MSNLDQYDRKWPSQPSVDFKSAPLTTRLNVLFGGFILNFGAAFFTFGMIFIWVFGASTNFNVFKFWFANTAIAPLVVTGSFETSAKENERRVVGYDYTFTTPDDQLHKGVAYSSTSSAAGDVEYVVSDPSINQMVDYRSSTFPWWVVLLVGIFPGVGGIMMLFGIKANRKKLKAFSNSKLARGKLVSKEATNTQINNRMVYKYTFEFIDEKGNTHQAVAKTHQGADIEDEAEERIIYNADWPENAVLVDNLPGKPEVSEDGTVGGVNAAGVLMRMILPVGGITSHLLVGIWMILR